MLIPSRRNRSLLGIMADPFDILSDVEAAIPKPAPLLMRTDIKESDTGYELSIDLPGCKKEDISAEIKDGYLRVSASREAESEEKDEQGTFIRKERFSGKTSRNFYVGDDISEDDIKAKFEDGVLRINVPKKEEKPVVEEKKSITIDG